MISQKEADTVARKIIEDDTLDMEEQMELLKELEKIPVLNMFKTIISKSIEKK